MYPKPGESAAQLRRQGFQKIDDYGSFWVVQGTQEQIKDVTKKFADRSESADYLNRIELTAGPVDTTRGDLSAPDEQREAVTPGKQLRLIQFHGPVRPDWLAAVHAIDGATIVSYIPNNAYIVWLDAAAEQKLRQLKEPAGPIQWIGPYRAAYKISKDLASELKAGGSVDIRLGLVNGPEADATANVLQNYSHGQQSGSYGLSGQVIVQLSVQAEDIPAIAHLPNVIWIEKIESRRLFDEEQDLILASQTNQLPGHSPLTNGLTYLEFLTNVVAGGQSSITNQSAYPIIDVADSGLDTSTPLFPNPVFFEFGSRLNASRVAYLQPDPLFLANGTSGDTQFGSPLGCPRLNDNFDGWEDFCGHGTFVASIIAGYYTVPNQTVTCVANTYPNTQFFYTFPCTGGNGQVTTNVCFENWNPPPGTLPCTNITIACSGVGTQIFSIYLPNLLIVTQQYCLTTQDPPPESCSNFFDTVGGTNIVVSTTGIFQLGLGVSPYGRIGISRIFSQSAHTIADSAAPPCNLAAVLDTCVFCVTDEVAFIASAYGNGARIQNDSWSDGLDISGDNGGEYNGEAVDYDTGVRDALLVGTSNNVPGPFPLNQEFIAVFASGGQGSSGNVGGFGDIRVTAPATAKNVITVGASDNVRLDGSGCAANEDQADSYQIASFSGVGPTLDGRFKPEIVAPGSSVYGAVTGLRLGIKESDCSIEPVDGEQSCTDPNGSTTSFLNPVLGCDAGTSFAAPAVAGGIQLLWWYFQNRLTNELGQSLLQPSPAMAKAYLCNSARYLPFQDPTTGTMDTLPSMAQGMGEMDLLRMFDGVPRLIRDESTPRAIDVPLVTTNPAPQQTYFSQSGQSYEVSGSIASSNEPFRVTLAWTDPPGTPAAQQELVNSLELQVTVIDVTGTNTYKGNHFIENESVPGGLYDTVNNMQSVFLTNAVFDPIAGASYQVIVRAANIAGSGVPNIKGATVGQDFALVVYNSDFPSDVPTLATNNGCSTALAVTNFPYAFTNTLTATANGGVYANVQPSPSAAQGGADEFFKLPLPTPGTTFTIDTTGSQFDTVLSVWKVQVLPQTVFVRGECGALIEVTSDNGGIQPSAVSFTADGSNDYFIVVEPHNGGPGGPMVLNVNASQSAITVTPDPVLFPDQVAGTTGGVQVVTYQNGTSVNVGISSVAIGGSNASDFVIESQSCQGNEIGSGTDCTVAVAFAPTTNGTRSATLEFFDDATGSPRLVPMTGDGLPAAPLVCLSAASLVFSNQLTGQTNFATVTLTNCGSEALVMSNVTITGPAGADFFTNSISCLPLPATLDPGGICSINVGFGPTTNGMRSATLSIADNAGDSPQAVSLVGDGCSIIMITQTNLPSATEGASYSQLITASGGSGTLAYAITSGALPPGMNLSGAGTLYGIPTKTGSYTFTVTVTDVIGCTGSQSFTLLVICPSGGLVILPATLTGAQVASAYSQTLSVSNGVAPVAYAVSFGAVPPGLTLSSAGILSGTPTLIGTFPFTVTATDTNGCQGSQAYSMVVGCPTVSVVPSSLPNGTVGVFYDQSVFSFVGTAPFSFTVTGGALPTGLTLSISNAFQAAISGTPSVAGNFTFTITATDANGCTGSTTYAISTACGAMTLLPSALPNAAIGLVYSQALSVEGETGTVTFIRTSGSLPPGLTLTSSGIVTGTPTAFSPPAQPYQFQVKAIDAESNCLGTRNYHISVGCGAISVSPASLEYGQVGLPYNESLTATNGKPPYTFAQTSGSLPTGISLSSAGTLSGTPLSGSTFFVVTVTDANGCSTNVGYTLIFSNNCPTISLSPTNLTGLVAGTAFSQGVTATGGQAPYTFTVLSGELPAGLALSSSGTLSGTPNSTSTFGFTIVAFDANGCPGFQAYSVTPGCSPIGVATSSLATGIIGVAYSQSILATDGIAPLTFSLTGGSLPPGLSLTNSGTISGTPTTAGAFNPQITVTDSAGCAANKTLGLVILPSADLSVTATAAPNPVVVGSNVTYSIVITNLGPSVAASVTLTDALPAGLTFVSTSTGCGASSNVVGCQISSLASGASTALTVVAVATTAENSSNTIRVASGAFDPNLANNEATVVVTATNLLGFGSLMQVVNAGAGGAIVTVTRLGRSDTPVTVQYATSDGTAVAGTDYTATSGVLTFGPGVVAQSFTVPILNQNPGKTGKKLTVSLDDPINASLDSRTNAVIEIVGAPTKSPVVFTDSDGDVVTVKLAGAGSMEVSLAGTNSGPVNGITLFNTDGASSLSVTVKRGPHGNGQVEIGGISGTGSLKAIQAGPADLTGDGISLGGSLGSVTVNSIGSGAIISAASLGSVTAQSADGAAIFAGFTPANADDPMAGGTFAGGSKIGSVKIQDFTGSFIVASQIGRVQLNTVATNNGGQPFGVLAQGAFTAVTVVKPSLHWSASGTADQSAGDFHMIY